jgi:hypothetical protein
MSQDTIIWVHGDNLNPHSAAFRAAPGAPAIFVWDEALLEEWQISFKRIVFIYECVLELPVIIRRGNVAEEVVRFAEEHQARRILTSDSPSPRHRSLCQTIIQGMPKGSRLEVVGEAPFVDEVGFVDLKRFSRYWNTVKKRVMR